MDCIHIPDHAWWMVPVPGVLAYVLNRRIFQPGNCSITNQERPKKKEDVPDIPRNVEYTLLFTVRYAGDRTQKAGLHRYMLQLLPVMAQVW